MSAYHRCTRCNSDMMMDGVYVADAGGTRVVVSVDSDGTPARATRPVSTQVHASVCGSCGFVELWANRPDELWDVYLRTEQEHAGASAG